MSKPIHSFRSGRSQAKQLAIEMSRHGQSRHDAKVSGDKGGIQGIGTERATKQALAQFGEWLHRERLGDLRTCGREAVVCYLEQRAGEVRQASLDMERQGLDRLQRHLHGQGTEPLPRIKSELVTIRETRAYSANQLAAIRAAQSPKHALMTELCERCGLRAHEGFTILPLKEQPPSGHREWRSERFTGTGVPYTVIGKGGLCRQIQVPFFLAARLESYRLAVPERVCDRGIFYTRAYSVGAGQNWSQSFSSASKRVLGWSTGGHGARHSYIQRLVSGYQQAGYSYNDALLLASQCAGHFRASIVSDFYLR